MRRVVLTLAALGLLALVADQSVASPPKSSYGTTTMVKHRGYSSFYDSRYRVPHSYRYGHHGYRYGHYRPPVMVYPSYGYPSIHRYGHGCYRPYSGFYYRGRGFGLSITF